MGERIEIPDIPEEVRTPLVKGLLELIECLAQKVRQQEEKVAQLGIFEILHRQPDHFCNPAETIEGLIREEKDRQYFSKPSIKPCCK